MKGIMKTALYMRLSKDDKYVDISMNKKIIEGNMQAISRGLSPKESANSENALVQAILQEAENCKITRLKC